MSVVDFHLTYLSVQWILYAGQVEVSKFVLQVSYFEKYHVLSLTKRDFAAFHMGRDFETFRMSWGQILNFLSLLKIETQQCLLCGFAALHSCINSD